MVKVCFNRVSYPQESFEEKLPKEVVIRLFENQDEIIYLVVSPILIVEEMTKNNTEKSDDECNSYQSAEDAPDPTELRSDERNLMVFDVTGKTKHM